MEFIKIRKQVDSIMDEMNIPDLPYELVRKRIFPSIKEDGTFEKMKVVTLVIIGDVVLKPTGDNNHITKTELRAHLKSILAEEASKIVEEE